MEIYRATLTPARAKKLVALTKKLKIADVTGAHETGTSKMYQSPRATSDGLVVRFSIVCTKEQKESLSALYPSKG